MTLTAQIMTILYLPAKRKTLNQCSFLADCLFYDFFHQGVVEYYLAKENANEIYHSKRLLPVDLCRYYLDRKAVLRSDILDYTIPHYPDHCIQLMVDSIYAILQKSNIYPQDIGYLNQYYCETIKKEDAAQYIAEVVWYVMQTEDRIDRSVAA